MTRIDAPKALHPGIGAAPTKNAGLPVGVPDAGAMTVTPEVNVTDWPLTLGLTDEATRFAPALTVWSYAEEVEALKFASPP